jgi:hypothetical protein
MVRAHPVSASYETALRSHKPPVVTFSSLAFARITKSNADVGFSNTVVVKHSNVNNDDDNDASIGVVVYCNYDSNPDYPLGLSARDGTPTPSATPSATPSGSPSASPSATPSATPTGLPSATPSSSPSPSPTRASNNLCCEIIPSSSADTDADSSKSTFTFTMANVNDISGDKVAFQGMGFSLHSGSATDNEFFKLCVVLESTLFPYKEVAILLDNSIEYGDNNRRSARQQGDDSAEDVELPATQIFLDLAPDGVLTVSFDDQQQPVISVEPNDEVVPQKEVSTTSPQLEDENNTTEQITTTLLGLIIGAVLILLVIVVIAVMMLNKRKEAAAKVYPFWMPGTDVTKTTVQA